MIKYLVIITITCLSSIKPVFSQQGKSEDKFSQYVPYVNLSKHAYEDPGFWISPRDNNKTVPEGFRQIDVFADIATGLDLRVYVNKKSQDIVVAFGGTKTNGISSIDVMTDLKLAQNKIPKQFQLAEKIFIREIKSVYGDSPKYTFTGHSLGGGLANYLGQKYDIDSVTFNAVNLNQKLWDDVSKINKNIDSSHTNLRSGTLNAYDLTRKNDGELHFMHDLVSNLANINNEDIEDLITYKWPSIVAGILKARNHNKWLKKIKDLGIDWDTFMNTDLNSLANSASARREFIEKAFSLDLKFIETQVGHISVPSGCSLDGEIDEFCHDLDLITNYMNSQELDLNETLLNYNDDLKNNEIAENTSNEDTGGGSVTPPTTDTTSLTTYISGVGSTGTINGEHDEFLVFLFEGEAFNTANTVDTSDVTLTPFVDQDYPSITWGTWGTGTITQVTEINTKVLENASLGYFLTGDLSNEIQNAVLPTGTATYIGEIQGTAMDAQSRDIAYQMTGAFSSTVDFSSNSITNQIDSLQVNGLGNPTLSGASITGDIENGYFYMFDYFDFGDYSNVGFLFEGDFYGSGYDSLGGVFRVFGNDIEGQGAFIGTQGEIQSEPELEETPHLPYIHGV